MPDLVVDEGDRRRPASRWRARRAGPGAAPRSLVEKGAALDVAGVGRDHHEVDRQGELEERRRRAGRRTGPRSLIPALDDDFVESDAADQREGHVGEDVVEQVVAARRASDSQPTRIAATPISAAGVPPRKTIATTRARKLPEIFTFDSVETAVRSLKIEKASRTANRARSQLHWGARQTPAAAVISSTTAMLESAKRVGRLSAIGLVWAASRTEPPPWLQIHGQAPIPCAAAGWSCIERNLRTSRY